MRLIKQSFLYFKEGNSDKVYEIDLCDAGNDKYVVNFRYGKRGSVLKEGSKTPVPVIIAEAEKIYDAVETEKLNKGYSSSESGSSAATPKAPFELVSSPIVSNDLWSGLPDSAAKAILKRLHSAVNGQSATEKFPWKLSRVIWKAGDYKINAAVPYIIKLFSAGDQLHQYSCTWSLVRCCDNDAAGIQALKTIFATHPVNGIKKLAGAGLLRILSSTEKEAHVNHYLNRLPEVFKPFILTEDGAGLTQLLTERINQQQTGFNWLEDVYLLSLDKKWLRKPLQLILDKVPLRPNYFKHIRAIFKLSEMLDDFDMAGRLSVRFERDVEMFTNNGDANSSVFVPELDAFLKPATEIKKNNSRLAYSKKTRWYFHKRVLRKLRTLGNQGDTTYVKLATAILKSYRYKDDFAKHYSTRNYVLQGNNYAPVETRFLQNAQAVFLHQLLSGNNPAIKLQANHLWRMSADTDRKTIRPGASAAAAPTDIVGGFIKKLTGFFSKKPATPPPPPVEPTVSEAKASNASGTPFLELWNAMPQAYVQLLIETELEEIHQFAEGNLKMHPDYVAIKSKLDTAALIRLLRSPFPIPAKFGYEIAAEKFADTIPDSELTIAMLNSVHEPARLKGQSWTEKYQANYLQQSHFIAALIFANNSIIREWANVLLKNNQLANDLKTAVVVKSVAELMSGQLNGQDELIHSAGNTLVNLFSQELLQLNIEVVADLLQSDSPAVLLFGIRLLILQKPQLELNTLSKSFLFALIEHPHPQVRSEGLALLAAMPVKPLLEFYDKIIGNMLSPHENVRKGLPAIISRMAAEDKMFGIMAAEKLMPVLLRKETIEGIHADVSHLLCNELSGYLQGADKQLALNLLYSNYAAAQDVGVMILEKYTDAAQLTIPQVMALANHENLNVREWSWQFYNTQAPRIKFEKEVGIKLLDSKWDDSRQFAIQYFREQFSEADWSPEVLITLADAVRPDVEAFGRELITRFFTADDGVTYLLKLSQHPSEKMQLFATNYLERFAAGDVQKIQDLNFYFRSVLTRVNKSRIAKNRIYQFLLQEGRKSEMAAKAVSEILSDVSAIAAIGDKAKCIDILIQLKALYDVATPLQIKETVLR